MRTRLAFERLRKVHPLTANEQSGMFTPTTAITTLLENGPARRSVFEQLFEGLRKASESSMFAQQQMLKQLVQHWPSASLTTAQVTLEGTRAFQPKWIEMSTTGVSSRSCGSWKLTEELA